MAAGDAAPTNPKQSPVTGDPSVEESNARKGEENYQSSFQDSRLAAVSLHAISAQSLQNAVNLQHQMALAAAGTADLVAKQAVAQHAISANAAATAQALSVDKLWNIQIHEAAGQAGVLHAAGMSGVNMQGMIDLFAAAVAQGLAQWNASTDDADGD